MRNALDQLAAKSVRLIDAPLSEVQTSALQQAAASQRSRTAARLLRALGSMSPEACETILRAAEAFAFKFPAQPRLHLVRAGQGESSHEQKELPNG